MRYKIDTSVKLVKHTYPGPPVRPIPRFSIDIPTHWLMTEFPGALFAMAPAADAPGPWSNVVISVCVLLRRTVDVTLRFVQNDAHEMGIPQ